MLKECEKMKEENQMPMLVFDDSIKGRILEALGFKAEDSHLVDEEGLIQTNQQFETVSAEEFGGVLKGSKIVIKKDVSDIVSYFANKED